MITSGQNILVVIDKLTKASRHKSSCLFLIGYKVSGGNTLGFLQSLKADNDPAIREAGEDHHILNSVVLFVTNWGFIIMVQYP
jgi:hypothetical protein